MSYKIYFIDKNGNEKKIEKDSYNLIKNIHENIKYEQRLPVSIIMKKGERKKSWFDGLQNVIMFKNKKRR